MEIRSQQEALFIACEMEKSAIQLYTRALMLLDQQGRSEDPLAVQIRQTCEDERGASASVPLSCSAPERHAGGAADAFRSSRRRAL